VPNDMKGNHYATLFAIIALVEAGKDATAKEIADITLMHADSAARIANHLFELGVVERDRIVASHGKGHQYRYRSLIGVKGLLPFLMGLRGRKRKAE